MELDFDLLASAYAARLKADREKDTSGYLNDVKDFTEAELAVRFQTALDRTRSVRVLSVHPDSGSSATMVVEHLPNHAYPAWRTKEVVWRKGNHGRNAQTARGIVGDILRADGISSKILNTSLAAGNMFDALWREAAGIVSGILNAAFRNIDKHELEDKKRDNIAKAKEARILAWRNNLKDSIKGLLREGIVYEDIQQALNEVLVESVQEM